MKGLKEQVRAGEITAQEALNDLIQRDAINRKTDGFDLTKTPTYRWLKARGAKKGN